MDLSPDDVLKAGAAVKTALDTFKSAVDLIRSIKNVLPTSKDTEALELALGEAEKAAQIAEAQIAQALGYQFCRAHFPPVVMLDVGYRDGGRQAFVRVFECPDCGATDAGGWMFTR